MLQRRTTLEKQLGAQESVEEPAPIMQCAYDSATRVRDHDQKVRHQEPVGWFHEDEWPLHRKGDVASGEEHDQQTRVASLQKIFGVIPAFFEKVLPKVPWWLSSGALIGAMRSGTIIPWDTDGDITADRDAFLAEENLFALGANATSLGAAFWPLDLPIGHRAVVPLPPEVDPTGDVVLATYIFVLRPPLPPSMWYPKAFEGTASLGRFVDLRTGYFVDILDEAAIRPDLIFPLRRCLFGGARANVPRRPVDYLRSSYEAQHFGLHEDSNESTSSFHPSSSGNGSVELTLAHFNCKVCRKQSPVDEARSRAADPFRVSFAPSGRADGDVLWAPVHAEGHDCELPSTSSLPAGWVTAKGTILVRETCL